MRLYCINNMYLSSIQQGIQAAHAAVDLVYKYSGDDSSMEAIISDWANNHKTMIVLNGGYSSELYSLLDLLAQQDLFPFASFCEEEASLNGALTSVSVLLPSAIYNTMQHIRQNKISIEEFKQQRDWKPLIGDVPSDLFKSDVVVELMYKLNQYRLAI